MQFDFHRAVLWCKALQCWCQVARGIVIRNTQANKPGQFFAMKGRLGFRMQVEHSPCITQE